MRYAYFPGCTTDGYARDAGVATRKIARHLGLELIEIPGWSCCGSSHTQNADHITALVANARNIALAEQMGLPILTICSTCTLILRQAKQQLTHGLKQEVNRYLAADGLKYQGTASITHLLWELDRNPAILHNNILKSFAGLKVACYYGCHLNRPPEILDYEDSQNPESMEKLVTALGAEPVPFRQRLDCCGFHALFPARDLVLKALADLVEEAAASGAAYIVTPCNLCQINLDFFQEDALKQEGRRARDRVPVLHLSQFMALSARYSYTETGINRLLVTRSSPRRKSGGPST